MKIFKSFKNNKNAKNLVENFFALSVLKFSNLLFSFITLSYITKVIGVENFGIITFATVIVLFIETVVDWGFNYTAVRDIARCRDNLTKVSQIVSDIYFAKIILMSVCFVILLIAVFSLEIFDGCELIILLTFTYIPGHLLYPEWLFQAYEKMKYITLLTFISKVVALCLIFVLIKKESDYIYYPIITSLGYVLGGIFAIYLIRKELKIKLIKPIFKESLYRITRSTNVFMTLLLPNLYTGFSMMLLKSFWGDFAVGIYNGGQKLQAYMDQILLVLSRTFFPFLSRNKDKHNVYVKISLVVSVILSFSMFFGAEFFVSFFLTKEFVESIIVIKIFSLAPICTFLTNTYGINYLILVSGEKVYRNIILYCSLFGFVLTLLLTPKYGYVGCSLTIVFVWFVQGVITYIYAQKIKRNVNI